MDRPLTPLSELGAETSAALEAFSDQRARALETARRNFLEAALRRPGTSPRFGLPAWAAVGVVALAAAVFVSFWRRPEPLAFTADGRPGVIENWVAAPVDRSVALAFSDGSVLQVKPSSRARVVATDEHGASVALENGSVEAHVVHQGQTAWRVIAGPVTVRVTGTRFEVNWSAPTEVVSVKVTEGSVAVSALGDERPVKAGEVLRVLVGERRVELTSGPESARRGPPVDAKGPVPNEATAAVGPGAEAALEGAESRPRAKVESGTARANAPAWRELIRGGSLRNAFAAAEEEGFDAACREASAAELLALGDGARLSGRSDRANQALRALRSRYPSDPRRAAAAFALGKVAFDEARDFRTAAEWFRTSLREQPGGSLSREASGRLLEALQRGGDAAGAERAARDYLERYPTGPHAALARSILR